MRLTRGARQCAETVFAGQAAQDAGQGWEGVEARLRLQGWSRERRVVVLRRVRKSAPPPSSAQAPTQPELPFGPTLERAPSYEYAVLVTSLALDVPATAQLYRDRGDAENPYDELKNHWGWGGFTTHDLQRCRIMARHVALVYNWWSLFVRLAIPERHAEVITSRPLLLHAVGRQTTHAGQTRLTITSMHGEAGAVPKILAALNAFFRWLRTSAEQLDWAARWRILLSRVFVWFLGGRLLTAPRLLEDTS
ncbi:MAG: transposase [Candidatus Sumerlaeota bacterium]|nr:transposase [Candidatus Sumerlaeota bacterium]